jgi:hypothetical protein
MTLATLSSLAALLGDLIWLAAEAVIEPLLDIPRSRFFWLIGVCFVTALILLVLDGREDD